MVHLKTQTTRSQPTERKSWKWRLTRRLYERGYERQAIVNLYRFIDWVMQLPEELELEFRTEVEQWEREDRMPYLSTIERMARQEGLAQGIEQGLEQGLERGIEQGLERGIERGRKQGERALILRQLARRFGEISPQCQARIEALALDQLEALGEVLLDFQSGADLDSWLDESDG
nr:DUF4351 domain-containing protein [Synechococcus sp. PCC 7336]